MEMRYTHAPLVAIIVVCLMLGLPKLMVTSYTVDDIEGASSVELNFSGVGSKTVNLSIQRPFKMISAKLNVSGGPSQQGGQAYPLDVSVDVGGDGDKEWAFDGVGNGRLGRQDIFSDGNPSQDLAVESTPFKIFELLLPENATITDANMTLTPESTPAQRLYNRTDSERLAQNNETSHMVTGINSTDIIINDTVRLDDIKALKNVIDVDQGSHNQEFVSVFYAILGQSFMINSSDARLKNVALYTIELETQPATGSSVDYELKIYNASPIDNYKPTGSPIATKHISQWVNGYFNFTFDNPLVLEAGKVYFFSLTHINGPYPTLFYDQATINDNPHSKYPASGCYAHNSSDNGATWTTNYGNDLVFRTHIQMARALNIGEALNITVDNNTYVSFDGGALSFTTGRHYSSSGWNISLNNRLPHEIMFNFSAELYFNDAPDHVLVDIGSDGTSEYSNNGNLTASVVISGLKDSVEEALQTAIGQGKGQSDSYGNVLVPVQVNVSSGGKGHLRLDALNIRYEYFSNVPGLLSAIEEYATTHPGTGLDALQVPIVVTTSAPGIVNLSGVNIIFDGAPQKVGTIPTKLSIPEEGSNSSLVDLNEVFQDDFDADLQYTIIDLMAPGAMAGAVKVSVTATKMLAANVSTAINWSGLVTFDIVATDDAGFNVTAGPVNITVMNINDGPTITSAPLKNANVGKLYRYNYSVVDSDSSNLNIWLEKAPPAMDLDRPNMTILWTPDQSDLGTHNFGLKVSDGSLECIQNISLIVRPSGSSEENGAPTIEPVGNRTITLGTNLSIQLDASDPDMDLLTFSLVSGPDGLAVNSTSGLVTWHPTSIGNYSATVRVSDGFLGANLTFNISVVAKPPAAKPNITIDRPYANEKISGPLTMIGKASVKDGKISKVEYQIDDGQWQNADLMPDGSWSAEYSTKDLKKGTHTLLVRATDQTGQKAQTYTTFVLKGRDDGNNPSGLDIMTVLPYLLLIIITTCAIVLGLAVAKSRSKGVAKAAKSSKSKPTHTQEKAMERTGTATKNEGASKDVESAFLVYHDGRLITYSSKSEIADLDATLQVIKDFVKASFRGDVGRLDALRYENMNIILERGVQMYLVIITPQEDSVALQSLRRRMRSFLGDVHERYRHILKVWDGKYKTVKPIEKMVEDLVKDKWSPGPVKEKEEKKGDGEDGKEDQSKRWDESPDLEDKDLSKVEKQKLLQDKLTRGEISELEFEKLYSKLG